MSNYSQELFGCERCGKVVKTTVRWYSGDGHTITHPEVIDCCGSTMAEVKQEDLVLRKYALKPRPPSHDDHTHTHDGSRHG